MKHSIYGVDIEKGAVDIARLRFWLAMVVDETEPLPLPNLHFKIMQGNSLLESYNNHDLTKISSGYDRIGQATFDLDGYRQMLRNDINNFYNTNSHEKRAELLENIKRYVICQIFEETKDENFLKNIKDVTGNDKFFLWHTWFGDVFEKGGFDIVIGNQPYLLEGKADKSIFDSVKDSPYYQGKMNLWYMFACQGLDMLKLNGNLCFIATNNWITSSGAKKLRNKIAADAQILQMCDFRNFMIFETASIQTMIMQFKKSHVLQEYEFDLRNLLGDKLEDVIQLLNKDANATAEYLTPTYNRLQMRNRFITFSSSDELLNKMSRAPGTILLGNEEIAQGIVFPQDFLNKKGQQKLGHHNIGEGIFGLSDAELINLHLTEAEQRLIKPYYTTEQVKRYYTVPNSNNLWLIYTDSSFKNSSSMDEYPILKAHLDQFIDIFTSDNRPYGLHRSRDSRFFIGEKVICLRKCAEKPVFSYSEGDCYLTQTFNIIKTDKINLRYLTGLLNSKLIAFWLRNRGKMQGANFQLDKEPLQQIPIAVPSPEYQQRIADIVTTIIEHLASNADASIIEFETQIDLLVYKFYGLDYDEVLIIDHETPISREKYENFNLD